MLKISALSKMAVEQLTALPVQDVLQAAFPALEVQPSAPGCWGHGGDITISKGTVSVPDGAYSSRKHFHRVSSAVVGFESGRRKLNIAPLVLIETKSWNGDFGSMKTSYFLVSRNEDGSHFAHKIRPNAGGSIESARRWMWQLREGESVSARQGDLALIPVSKPRASVSEIDNLGNHFVDADEVRATKRKVYAFNPTLSHEEHRPISLSGWFELRLARAWMSSAD